MKNNKAQGISMNVIIIAAIALLVLVILSVIFLGKMGGFGKGVGDCTNKGGTCQAFCDPELSEQQMFEWSCGTEEQNMGNDKCCLIVT